MGSDNINGIDLPAGIQLGDAAVLFFMSQTNASTAYDFLVHLTIESEL